MDKRFSQEVVIAVMVRLGHTSIRETKNQAIFIDNDTKQYISIAFTDGFVGWDDLSKNLDNEGITPSLFIAEFESM